MNYTIYLDLEGTVIDSWDEGNLINTNVVKNFLAAVGVSTVGIFSFAIDGAPDFYDFENRLLPRLEDALCVRIGSAPTVYQMMMRSNCHGRILSLAEYKRTTPKLVAFKQYIAQSDNAVLIDDDVPNQILLSWPSPSRSKTPRTIQTIDVHDLDYRYWSTAQSSLIGT